MKQVFVYNYVFYCEPLFILNLTGTPMFHDDTLPLLNATSIRIQLPFMKRIYNNTVRQ